MYEDVSTLLWSVFCGLPRMCSVEADLLSILGHMPGEEEDVERKLSSFEKDKDKLWRKKFDEQKKLNAQLSRHQFQKEQEE